MELWPGPWTMLLLFLLLLLLLVPVLWGYSSSAKYFCKMAFYNGWILFLAVLAIPVCALRGRNVENMKILRLMLLHIKYLYGIRLEVRGAHNFPPSQPYVVVSNHQSSLDLLGMMEVLPGRCVPIAKRELLWAGPAGIACWLAGVIFIDRKRTGDAISVMAEAAQTLLSQNVRVWVFPEGTRNHNGSMLPFKRGAFHLAVQAQVPIIPIVMSSYQDFYCKKERRFNSGTCQALAGPPYSSPLLPSHGYQDCLFLLTSTWRGQKGGDERGSPRVCSAPMVFIIWINSEITENKESWKDSDCVCTLLGGK
ncbi:1-acyl-sn-glycerol-3-phosphate acyltransferase alpha isoform X2 [Monodelphis domestica]|uniref:1-acyl-sn-glycerol-3-phosphate acyltransferase n=2 Tax=Monodelphis domestica TaxID=13616 RepID=A0A5F8G731_MONDO|nr:1-acyl-sn-glycerol-3-phosphate acyltransferase alpha isoform X2 [Monodelphis domestica]XP_056673914.1 1-acyl-sn-glycerol-3-phosphate acyltransferase alpha isoform X2 [Monodelphis domestica]XP_056673915.1 1-acyl-sn-glycerol-3-phosphate acyltransferase alpha isoform X2 [Monodelphis domestica]